MDKALSGCDTQHATVLLAHQPKAAKYALDTNHDIQLVLAGEENTLLFDLLPKLWSTFVKLNNILVYVKSILKFKRLASLAL